MAGLSGGNFVLLGQTCPTDEPATRCYEQWLCDQWGVNEPRGLPADVLDREPRSAG